MDDLFKNVGNQQTLGQVIVEVIEKNILDKKLRSGQKLPTEKELCEMFGVSRTALREALQMLSAKGLIRIRKGSGTYVTDFARMDASENPNLFLQLNFDKDYALHLVHTRQIIEPQIARLAARNRSDDNLELLEENLAKFSDPNIDSERHALLDLEFHQQIAEACQNPVLRLTMEPLFKLMPRMKTIIVSEVRHNDITQALAYHRDILDNIREKNEEAAFIAMQDHLKIAENDLLHLIQTLNSKAERSAASD